MKLPEAEERAMKQLSTSRKMARNAWTPPSPMIPTKTPRQANGKVAMDPAKSNVECGSHCVEEGGRRREESNPREQNVAGRLVQTLGTMEKLPSGEQGGSREARGGARKRRGREGKVTKSASWGTAT